MTPEAREEIIRRILEREGGVADVGDGMGITRYGQTPQWLTDWQLPSPATAHDAAANYRVWLERTRLDRLIEDEADSLADAVIDLAVHSGHVTAIKSLQRAVKVTADGVIGPMTLAAARRDRRAAAAAIIAWRCEQHGALIAGNPAQNARYARGWARRMAEHIRRLA